MKIIQLEFLPNHRAFSFNAHVVEMKPPVKGYWAYVFNRNISFNRRDHEDDYL